MDFDWKKTLSAVAPIIGTAIGSPLSGVAIKAVTEIFGLPHDASNDEISSAMKSASPDQLLALKKADQDFKKTMRELDIKEDQLHASDRDSARKREVALGGDKISNTIAVYTVVAFSVMIGWILVKGVPETLDKMMVGTIIGYVVGLTQQVYNFRYGSSKGSHDKTRQMSEAK